MGRGFRRAVGEEFPAAGCVWGTLRMLRILTGGAGRGRGLGGRARWSRAVHLRGADAQHPHRLGAVHLRGRGCSAVRRAPTATLARRRAPGGRGRRGVAPQHAVRGHRLDRPHGAAVGRGHGRLRARHVGPALGAHLPRRASGRQARESAGVPRALHKGRHSLQGSCAPRRQARECPGVPRGSHKGRHSLQGSCAPRRKAR